MEFGVNGLLVSELEFLGGVLGAGYGKNKKKSTNFKLCDKKFLKLIQAGGVFDFKPRLGRRDGDVEFIFDLGDFTLDIIDFLNILFY